MHTDLAILSAAHYDDGLHVSQARGLLTSSRPSRKPSSSTGDSSAQKKRNRPSSHLTQDEPQEDTKRARGRPRLDLTDQTPQDRRRTQIRLAQRAYRNRKESAITTLEKEVDELKEVTEHMSQAYRDLFDFATRQGLLEQAPEFAERIMQLEALKKRSAENSYKNVDDAEPDGIAKSNGGRRRSSNISLTEQYRSPRSRSQPQAHHQDLQRQKQPQSLFGGLIVTHEPDTEPETTYESPSSSRHSTKVSEFPLGYEIIAQPTQQNASFASGMLESHTFASSLWSVGPWNPLPNTSSYAFLEVTFGRRLRRSTLQAAANLITMESPPPDKLIRVFGLTRLFETHEQIKERTLASLAQSKVDPMSVWKYPAQYLGAAGTHLAGSGPGLADPKTGIGVPSSEETANPPHSPIKDNNSHFFGPLDSCIGQLRDSLVKLGSHISLLGFDGVFLDTDEVDFYLVRNGVNIPPFADHVEVQIVDGAFAMVPSDSSSSHPHTQPRATGHATFHTESSASTNLSLDSRLPSSARTGSNATTSTRLSSPMSYEDSQAMTTTSAEGWPPSRTSNAGLDLFTQNFSQTVGATGLTGLDNHLTNAFADSSGLGFQASNGHNLVEGLGMPQDISQVQTRTCRINVEKFINELVSKAVCLGRTPCFRPKDVDVAFWASIDDPRSAAM